jgi:uroporphyrinogen-III synthase
MSVRLLVTRPEPECERTAASLRERGHKVFLLPLLRIERIPDAGLGPGPWAAVLFTSGNAVKAITAHRRFGELAGLPTYVVGRRTEAAAAAAGFVSIVSADGDLDDLARLIASAPPDGNLSGSRVGRNHATSTSPSRMNLPLLYCAGEDRAGDLGRALQASGLRVETATVYRAAMVTDLTPDVRAAFASGEIDAVLHYSARSAAAFVAAATAAGVRDLSIRTTHLCLSDQVAAPLAAAGADAIEVAGEPNEQALLALVDRV